jgi:predicted RNA-binding protein with EMAP domain
MNDQIKLVLALSQIDSLTSLLEGNEYQSFLYSHLIQIQVELNRQLTNLTYSIKIKE